MEWFKNYNKQFKNSGDYNTGALNSGNSNTGDYNLGFSNSGSRNQGSFNTGDFNIGDFNTGDWNLAYGCAGAFCTEEKEIDFFDAPSGMTLMQWRSSQACRILSRARTAVWIPSKDMNLREKVDNPNYSQNGGYLRTYSIKEAFAILWRNLSDSEKSVILSMNNFDPKKFYQITNIKL